MTPEQEKNCLDWVAAMLSGGYKFGAGRLFDSQTGCHCALGVALELEPEAKRLANGTFLLWGQETFAIVEEPWFKQRFGLPNDRRFYTSLNDSSRNYLAVCALVLDACPNSSRKRDLQGDMIRQVNLNTQGVQHAAE